MPPVDVLTATSDKTTRMDTHEVVSRLIDIFGSTAVAYMANVKSRQVVARWALAPEEEGHVNMQTGARQRVLLAHSIFLAIEQEEDSEFVGKSWFLAANPRLGGATPMDLVRAFDAQPLMAVTQAFLRDSSGV